MNDKNNDTKNDRHALVMRRLNETDPVPPLPDRATRVASWVGWHMPELLGVSVPAMTAVTVTPWAWLASAAVGVGWTVHAVKTARDQAAVKAGPDLPIVPAGSAVDSAADAAADAAAADGAAGAGSAGTVLETELVSDPDAAVESRPVSVVDGKRVGGAR